MTTDYISGVIYVKPEVSAGYRPFYLRADMQSDCNGWLARAPNCTSGSTNTIRQMLADASMLLPLINVFPLLFRCNLLANAKPNGTQFGISVSFFSFFYVAHDVICSRCWCFRICSLEYLYTIILFYLSGMSTFILFCRNQHINVNIILSYSNK